MRDALLRIGSSYNELVGTSKILLLFVISIVLVILIDEKEDLDSERRRINPTVFLLSLWSLISYTIVRVLSGKKKKIFFLGLLFSAVAIALSGNIVLSEKAYKLSVYYYTDTTITILAVICIVFYFLIYYMISRQLFTLRKDRILFMLVALWLHIFDLYSPKAAEFSIFLSPVTISSIIIHDVLPLLLWLYLVYEDRIKQALESDEQEEETLEDYLEEWDMKKHKILNIRNMAIAFAILFMAFIGSVFVLNNKINSLYDATVVLENAANTKTSAYEFKNASGEVMLTVNVSPEGSVTVYGGGSRDNGSEVFDFIKDHADKVDKWYLYGENGENKGARDFCVENGLIIDETYVISGIEKID